jgi:metallophosphoesterase (TIGR03767 family)
MTYQSNVSSTDLPPAGCETDRQTLVVGAPVRHGTDGHYRGLVAGPGEAHIRRTELAPNHLPTGKRTSLIRFLQCTDLHLVDWQSPGRYEFVQRHAGEGPLDLLLAAYRPQECLQLQAVAAMVAGISRIGPSRWTGAPLQFLLCTGDFVDNMQRNEMTWWLDLVAGGEVRPGSGARTGEGAASAAWNDPDYWCPEPVPDRFKAGWGFPTVPGLLAEAARPFRSKGVDIPWLTCRGNHDLLIDGTAVPTPTYRRIVTGAVKARLLGRTFVDAETDLDLFIRRPDMFLTGPAAIVAPDAGRDLYTGQEWLTAHHDAPGLPRGHGVGSANLAENTAYYVNDEFRGIRLIVLDTVNPGGNFTGSIDAEQRDWLEQRLIETHSAYFDHSGTKIGTGLADRVVLVVSHHNLRSLRNTRLAPSERGSRPRVLAAEIAALLHRFPNVAAWINGHTHVNAVVPRPDPAGRTAGFWEVTTCSQIDWPGQTRLVEIIDNDNGTLSIVTTMVDHAAPIRPADGKGYMRLAALHRDLAANDPFSGTKRGAQGSILDRNVELVVRSPFA